MTGLCNQLAETNLIATLVYLQFALAYGPGV